MGAYRRRKGTVLEALQEQPDWEDFPTERWPGPEAVTFSTEHQLSPTQPNDKACKSSSNNSPPVSASAIAAVERFRWYSIVSENRAKQSLPPSASTAHHLASDTDEHQVSQEGCTISLVKPFFPIKPFSAGPRARHGR